MKNLIAIILLAIMIVAVLFAAPLLGLLVGMFIGWVLEIFAGSYVTDGLNLLFGEEIFVHGDLPQVTDTLGVIAGLFRAEVPASLRAE